MSDIEQLVAAALADIAAAGSSGALEELRVAVLGKSGTLTAQLKQLGALDPEQRRQRGAEVNAAKERVSAALAARKDELARAETQARLAAERVDVTLPGRHATRGGLHPLTRTLDRISAIFARLGYDVADGPEIEDDWHNFEALNFPPGHPARAMQDTLYVKLGRPEQVMLRTHTSPVQIRVMQSQPPPIYCVMPGRTYRNETLDARHSPVFHQIEGLAVDRGITFGDLAGTIEAFTSAYFRTTVPTRLLPSFFPFTEPSAEFAVGCVFCEGSGCRVCSQTGWIELGGCGMVDPNVFAAVGIDPEEYSGFAFGFGLERMPMLRYGVNPIKTFFDGDIRFLSQY